MYLSLYWVKICHENCCIEYIVNYCYFFPNSWPLVILEIWQKSPLCYVVHPWEEELNFTRYSKYNTYKLAMFFNIAVNNFCWDTNGLSYLVSADDCPQLVDLFVASLTLFAPAEVHLAIALHWCADPFCPVHHDMEDSVSCWS